MTDQPRAPSTRPARWALALYWPALAVSTHWPRLQLTPPSLALPTDKLLHALAFAGLAGLLLAALPRRRTMTLAGLALAAGYAVLDEYTQRWFARDGSLDDLVASLIGVALVGAMMIRLPARRPRPASPDAGHEERFVGHALLVAVLTFASRLTGLVRDAVIFALLGLSPVADAFFVGFLVPNLFRRLFGEGALSAAFIPHYTDLLRHDSGAARRFAGVCIGGLVVVTTAITLLGEAVLGLWLMRLAPTDKAYLAVALTMAMLPYMPLVCAVALAGSVLQVHRRFGPPAATPMLLNLAMIGFAGWAAWLGLGEYGVAWMLALAVLAAGLVQLAWQLVLVAREAGLGFGVAGTGPAARSMMVMMLPMVLGLAVFQINTLLDSLIAFGLSSTDPAAKLHLFGRAVDYPIESGAVGALTGGQRLYQFPLGVFAIAIATAIFPALAHAASRHGHDDFARTLRQGLRLSIFIGLPASAGLILLRQPLVQLFFERGQFTAADTQRTAWILAAYAAGVWAYSTTHVLTRAFYARKDARTPLRVSLAMVGFNLTLNLLLIWPMGAAGLALSTAISGSTQTLLLIFHLERAGVHVLDRQVLTSWGRTVVLTVLMSAAVWLATRWSQPQSSAAALAVVLTGVGVGAAVVLGGAWLSGAPEARWLARRSVSR